MHRELTPVVLYRYLQYNSGMRRLLLLLSLIPAACSDHNTYNVHGAGYGRGFINPLTVAQMKEHKCLATMVYGEARGEAEQGMIAVAYTALNRATKTTVCKVVLAPKQYSIFNNNPALQEAAMSVKLEPKQKNIIDKAGWNKSLAVAEIVIRRSVPDPTNGSTNYLAPIVMSAKHYKYPRWSKEYTLVVIIDRHRFYKMPTKVDKRVEKV